MVLVLGVLVVANGRLESAGKQSLHSAQVLRLASTAERLTVDAETSTRAYLLTGRAQYKVDARQAYFTAQHRLGGLDGSAVDGAELDAIQRDTNTLGRRWLLPALARPVTAPRPYSDFAPAEALRMHIEREYTTLVAGAQLRQSQRLAHLHALHHRAWWIALAAIVAVPALLIAFLAYVAFMLLRPVRALGRLARRVERGEEGVVGEVAGPREIAQVQDAFNRMSTRIGQRRREIVDHAPIVMWEVVGSRIRWISPFWKEIAGPGAPEPLTVADIDAVVHPEDREQLAELRRIAMATQEPFDYRFRIVRRDGQLRWLWTQAKPVGDEDGKPRVIGFTLDVTEDERMRHELAHAQRLESIGHLAGGVAHDFNNLLTVIAGYATLAQMRMHEPERLEEPLAEIIIAAQRASSLTRQLLMFSREQAFELQQLDLNEVVRSVVPMLERLIEERISLLCSLAEGLPSIRFDRGQLEQVIVNLAVNARDAIAGNGRIVLSTSAGADRTVRLSVTDDGAGIDPVTIEHIFDPFFTTKPPGEGTGLGLSTVHGIVARGGGHIEVDSRVGEGTTFTVCFPAATDETLTVAA
jgi:PAS domain S-box-containing protein